MIYLFFPKKAVPSWFQKVTAAEKGAEFGDIHHGGFGLVISRHGFYHVYTLVGACIKIRYAEDIILTGGGNGVYFHDNFFKFLRGKT